MTYLHEQTQPKIVERSASLTPQTTQTAYFTVTGRVLITQIIGEVTVEIGAGENSTELIANPTVGADVNMAAALDIDADAVGSIYTITGTLADAMIATTSGAVAAQSAPIFVAAGTIDLKTSASTAGQTKWTLHYISVDGGSLVEAA